MSFKSVVFLFVGLLVTAAALSNDGFSRTDAFEHTNLVSITASSTYTDNGSNQSNERDIFGATLSTLGRAGPKSTEGGFGYFVFSDLVIPPNNIDSIEWKTKESVPLNGFRIGLERDFDFVDHQAMRVRFMVRDDGGGWKVLSDFAPDYSPQANPPAFRGTKAITNVVFSKRVQASEFRMELTRDPNRRYGVRITEIDALSTPNPEKPTIEITNLFPRDTTYLTTEPVTMKVIATDPQGINRVELRLNGDVLASETTQRQFTVRDLSAGIYLLRAVAVDELGGEAEATAEIIVVDELPAVELSAPILAGGLYHYEITGPTMGRAHIFSTSADGMVWTPIATNRYPETPWTFSTSDPAQMTQVISAPRTRK